MRQMSAAPKRTRSGSRRGKPGADEWRRRALPPAPADESATDVTATVDAVVYANNDGTFAILRALDERGERIVLVTTQSTARKDELIAYARRYGATDMMIPDDIVTMEAIPVLGSGKVDYPRIMDLIAGHALG